jgi:hypothetical protein
VGVACPGRVGVSYAGAAARGVDCPADELPSEGRTRLAAGVVGSKSSLDSKVREVSKRQGRSLHPIQRRLGRTGPRVPHRSSAS